MQIGHRIAQLRNQKRISQKQLAAELHVSAGLVGLWETNKRLPSLDSFILLVDFFAISADFLLENDRKLAPGQYKNDPADTPPASEKLLKTFLQLNEDNQDILIGEAKKLLKSQKSEEKRQTMQMRKVT